MAERSPRRTTTYVTVAIVPHGGEPARALRVRRSVLQATALLLGLLIAGFLGLLNAYLDAHTGRVHLGRALSMQLTAYHELEAAYVATTAAQAQLVAYADAIRQRLDRLGGEAAHLQDLLKQADQRPASRSGARELALARGEPAGQGGPPARAGATPGLSATLHYADRQLELYDDQLRELRVATLEFLRRQAHTPSLWPAEGWLSSGFGPRRHPVTGQHDYHYGLDVAGRYGSPVQATAAGDVVLAGRRGSYGLVVVVDHGYGLQTLYGHLASLKVRAGDRVSKGQEIGRMGSTGLSTGPHVHYEVHVNGRPVNPYQYLP